MVDSPGEAASGPILQQVAQAPQPNLLPGHKRLAVADAHQPAPVTGPVAQIVQERRRRCLPAGDELRMITAQYLHFAIDVRADVEHERRLGMQSQMDTEVV